MKLFLNIIRWIVGLLFIFSGLVKANDPLGLAYKMEEFFEAWNWMWFHSYALQLSIAMNVFEVLAGMAIIIGWQAKLFSRLLLLLIVFFTFLTSYVLFSGKIKSCGCFGDCIPLTPVQTFIKDLVLLLFALILCMQYKRLKPIATGRASVVLLLVVTVSTICTQLFVLKHLPFVDCLPYKKGNNILEQMKVPAGAITDSFSLRYQYKKNGKVVEFDANNFPDDFDSTYEYVNRIDKLVRKGNAIPRIGDFALKTKDGNDTAKILLGSQQLYILVFIKDANTIERWKPAYERIKKHGIAVYIVSADAESMRNQLEGVVVFSCDATVIKTAARVQPTFFLMKGDLIVSKTSYLDTDRMEKQLSNRLY